MPLIGPPPPAAGHRPPVEESAPVAGAGARVAPRVALGLGISAAALWYALRGVALADVAGVLAAARPTPILGAVAVTVAIQVVRALRWRGLFPRGRRPGAVDAWCIVSVAYLVSAVLPLRAGDPARAWLAERRAGVGVAEALATVVAERVLDLLTIVALLALATPGPAAGLLAARLGPGPWASVGVLRAATALGLGGAYLGAVLVAARGEWLATRLGGGRPARWVARFVGAFAPLAHPVAALAAAAWSLALWSLGVAAYWLVMRGVGLDLSPAVALVTLGATAVFAVVPSSPGYVGVFHAAVRLALGSVDGVATERVVSYALLLHALTLGTLIAMGLAGAWALGLDPRRAARAGRAAIEPPPD